MIRNNSQITKARNYIICFIYKTQNKILNPSIIYFTLIYILQTFIYNFKFNIKYLIKLSMLVGISETIRSLSVNYFTCLSSINTNINSSVAIGEENKNNDSNKFTIHSERFIEWLAGLIDGDGCFLLSKKGYASLEIVMDIRDQHCLYQIKQKFGGSVKLHSRTNAIRYRLHNKKGLLNLINNINGEIRNPVRILQLERILNLYNINYKKPKPLTYNNGWLSGIFDSDGSIYLNDKSGQIFISISQKDLYILQPLVELYGGKIYPHGKVNAFKYTISRKTEILDLIKNYFSKYPSRTDRISRLSLVSDFYRLRNLHAHNSSPKSAKGKAWHYFLVKWSKYIRGKEK